MNWKFDVLGKLQPKSPAGWCLSHQVLAVSVFSSSSYWHPFTHCGPLQLKFIFELLSCVGTWVEIDDIFIFFLQRVAVLAHYRINLTQVQHMHDKI